MNFASMYKVYKGRPKHLNVNSEVSETQEQIKFILIYNVLEIF